MITMLRQLISRLILRRWQQSDRSGFNRKSSSQSRLQSRLRSFLILLIVLVLWCVGLGVGLAQATNPNLVGSRSVGSSSSPAITPSGNYGATALTSASASFTLAQAPADNSTIGTVDVIPSNYRLAQELYLENCASCHVGLPPQVLPTQTWRTLIQDAQHYGVQITPFRSPNLLLVWNYVRTFSRPLLPNEQPPYRIDDSRYFKALHPRVEFGDLLEIPARGRVEIDSCASCHPNAFEYNYRQLTPEWANAP